MILPFIIGYLVGKLYGKEMRVIMTTLLVGIIMGICGALELIPFVYPLYAARPLDWIGLPEYKPIAIYFAVPNFKLHQEVVPMNGFSIFVITVFTIICLMGIVIGCALGNRAFTRKTSLWTEEGNA